MAAERRRGAARRGGVTTVRAFQELRPAQRLRDPAQKNQGKKGRLTKGLGWPELITDGDVVARFR
jgi:hypothetical protein